MIITGALLQPGPAPLSQAHDLDGMLAAGGYERVHPSVTKEHFNVDPRYFNVQGQNVVYLTGRMTNGEAIEELDKIGYCPVGIERLLAFGATHLGSHAKGRQWIVGLASTAYVPEHRITNRLCVPYLEFSGSRYRTVRMMAGGDHRDIWDERFGFLVIRK